MVIIEDEAFYDCSGIEMIKIPDSVETMGINPFAYCRKLSSIIVSPDHPSLATIDGVLFSKADRRMICFPLKLSISDYSIPQGMLFLKEKIKPCQFIPPRVLLQTCCTIGQLDLVSICKKRACHHNRITV